MQAALAAPRQRALAGGQWRCWLGKLVLPGKQLEVGGAAGELEAGVVAAALLGRFWIPLPANGPLPTACACGWPGTRLARLSQSWYSTQHLWRKTGVRATSWPGIVAVEVMRLTRKLGLDKAPASLCAPFQLPRMALSGSTTRSRGWLRQRHLDQYFLDLVMHADSSLGSETHGQALPHYQTADETIM